ncbi:Large repetitive protein [Salmonella bongori]|nr:Large repetitive protein [Salmonella bongori]
MVRCGGWIIHKPGYMSNKSPDVNALLVTSDASHETGGAIWPWVLAGAVAAGRYCRCRIFRRAAILIIPVVIIRPPIPPVLAIIPLIIIFPAAITPTAIIRVAVTLSILRRPSPPASYWFHRDGKTVSGQAEAGSTIVIKDPTGNVVGEGKADSDGKFSVDLTTPQLSGEQLTVTATDDAGNTGPSATIEAPNVPLPETPTITAAIDDATPLTGTLSNNQFTNDSTPTLQGTGSAGAIIHIYANGQEIGTTAVDASGNWRFAITSALTEGENHFTAIAANLKGESSESTTFTLIIDTLIPDAPVVELIADNTGLLHRAATG